MRRAGHADRQDVFEAEQAADDERAVCPRACAGGDEAVAAGLDGVIVGIGGGVADDAGFDVIRVARVLLALRGVDAALAVLFVFAHVITVSGEMSRAWGDGVGRAGSGWGLKVRRFRGKT